MERPIHKVVITGENMTWVDAVNYAYSKGMYIPNYDLCEELGERGCWTSSTDKLNTFKARVFGEKKPVHKQELRPVVMCNYYKITDEGDLNHPPKTELEKRVEIIEETLREHGIFH